MRLTSPAIEVSPNDLLRPPEFIRDLVGEMDPPDVLEIRRDGPSDGEIITTEFPEVADDVEIVRVVAEEVVTAQTSLAIGSAESKEVAESFGPIAERVGWADENLGGSLGSAAERVG